MSLTILKRGPSPVTPEMLAAQLGHGDCRDVVPYIEAATEWVEAKICQKVRETEALWTFRKRGTPPLPVGRVRSQSVAGGCSDCRCCNQFHDYDKVTDIRCGGVYQLRYDVRVCESALAMTAIGLVAEAMQAGTDIDEAVGKILAPLMPSKCDMIAKKFGGLAVRQVG